MSSSLSFSVKACNEPSPKKTTRRRRRRRRVFSSSKQSASSSAGRRRRQREGRCDFFVPHVVPGTKNGSQNRRLCVVEATEEENGGSANMSARELKRALEEMVRRRLVSNLSLSLSLFVCVFVRFVRIESRQRGRRRRLLGAGKCNVDD